MGGEELFQKDMRTLVYPQMKLLTIGETLFIVIGKFAITLPSVEIRMPPPNVFVTEIENLNSMYPPGCIALNCDPLLCLLSHLTIPETITLLIVEQTILKFKKS